MNGRTYVMDWSFASGSRLVNTGKKISNYNVLLKMPITEAIVEEFINELDFTYVLGNAIVMPNKLTFGIDREYFYVLGGPADEVENMPIAVKYYSYRVMSPCETIVSIADNDAILNEIGSLVKQFDTKAPLSRTPDNHSAVTVAYSDGSVLNIFMSDGTLNFCTSLVKSTC